MKKITLLLAACVLAFGCKKKPSCDLSKQYGDKAAIEVAHLLDCKAPDKISLDIAGEIEGLHLCQSAERPQGIAASVVCPPISLFVTKLLLTHAIPSAWQCSGGSAAVAFEGIFDAACNTIPF